MSFPAQTEEASPFAVVDGVSEPGGVHDGQLQLHALLLDVHRVLGDFHRLADSLCGSETQSRSAAFNRVSGGCWIDRRLTFCVEQFSIFMQIGEEQAVHQRGFTQTRFS